MLSGGRFWEAIKLDLIGRFFDGPRVSELEDVTITEEVYGMGRAARGAALELATLSEEAKNRILEGMASGLRSSVREILEANAKDLAVSEGKGLSGPMLDRLRLNEAGVEAMAAGVSQVAGLPDPVGEELASWTRPNGMKIRKVRVPIGVIGIVYESRPNVTCDAAVLCLKSGNATILRGGSEAIHSNRVIAKILQKAGEQHGLPTGAVQLIPFTDRASVGVLAGMDDYLDLIIPRGGKGLIEAVVSQARMPVIKHYDGICHAYVGVSAEQDQAVELVVDSKVQKPSVCNALETLLVDQGIAQEFLPKVARALRDHGVLLRGCERSLAILGSQIEAATEEDWRTEYLDLTLSVKVVGSCSEAIEHINHYGSHHTDLILSEDPLEVQKFMLGVDSACVFHNLSTRFSDGEEFGFGAEIGISTDKLHARGPMGLAELTSYQYRVSGDGQTKAPRG